MRARAMAEREQIRKPARQGPDPAPAGVVQGKNPPGARLKEELDEILDEIDEVLETNAEEFVNSYIQKGGQ